MMNGGMGLMWIFGLLVIVLVVVLVKAFSGKSPNAGRPGAIRESGTGRGRRILEERYARGEISTEEYRERLLTMEEGDR